MGKTCEVCGRRSAMYVCQDCGRETCGPCFDGVGWICVECSQKAKPSTAPRREEEILPRVAIASPVNFFLVSFIIILIGMLLMMLGSVRSGPTSGGAVIFIGPIPIIVGAGPQAGWAIGLAVILTIIGFAFFFLNRRKWRENY